MELIEVVKGAGAKVRISKEVKVLRNGRMNVIYLPAGLELEDDYKCAKIFVDDIENIRYMEIHLLKEYTSNSYKLTKQKQGVSARYIISAKFLAGKLAEQKKFKSKKVEKTNNILKIWWE